MIASVTPVLEQVISKYDEAGTIMPILLVACVISPYMYCLHIFCSLAGYLRHLPSSVPSGGDRTKFSLREVLYSDAGDLALVMKYMALAYPPLPLNMYASASCAVHDGGLYSSPRKTTLEY